MKRKRKLHGIFALSLLMCLASCEQNKDLTIKADLTTKAMAELDFAGLRFTVDNRVVTLSGNCATEKAKNKVLNTVKKLYGVEDVISHIMIAPVIIGTDLLLKNGVDSILKQYPGVEAITKDSIVQLRGKIKSGEVARLTKQVRRLRPKGLVENFDQF